MSTVSVSVAAQTDGIDRAVNEAVAPFADGMSALIFYSVKGVPLIMVWLVVGAAFFTVYFGFISIRGFRHAIALTGGRYDNDEDPGEVSHFQALATALSGTVGLGNIAGVAIAISVGGPGATFWMILAGFLGMSSKFVECTLAVMYRKENPNGTVSGGPMYYISRGFAEKNMPGLGRVLAFAFAVMCIIGALGAGNMFQSNQAFQQVVNVTGGATSVLADKGWLFGLVLAFLVAIVIIGGIKSIARVTGKLVPFMAIIYVFAALVIILMNYEKVPGAIAAIFTGAFSPEGVTGGFIGVLVQGFRRAAFSNEAGVGTAPIAHAAVRTKEPVTQGLVSLLEPFIDTVVICTMTALVIVVTGMYVDTAGMSGVELTSKAFSSAFPWFRYVLTLAVILFAYSTMISWSYYGTKAWTYLFGETRNAEITYKAIFCLFIVLGSTMNLSSVVDFSDAMIFAMALVNICGLYVLAPKVKQALRVYLARLEQGDILKK
jgi:AGCS family alanine or glycine:cation symporter